MRILKRLLLPLCTLCLVGLGAAMPWLSARMEDERAGGFREELDLNVLSLTLRHDSGAADTLRLLGGAHTMLYWGGETALDPGDAEHAAYDLSELLVNAGVMDSKFGPLVLDSWFPKLVMSGDGADSAIVWHCSWGEGRYFFLDDATGKLAGGQFRRPGGMDVSAVNDQIAAWIDFCQDYYGVSLMDISWEADFSSGKPLEAGDVCILTFQPDYSEPFHVRLTFNERSIEFNSENKFTDAD